MITVRFQNGFSIQYNTANWCHNEDGRAILRTEQNGKWVATVPHASGAIIEAVTPCRMYQAVLEKETEPWKEIKRLQRKLAKLSK